MVYFKLGWREINKHPGRSILTLMSIVIGVAAVMAVTLTAQTTRRAFDDIYQSIAGRASLEVAGPLGTTFDAAILKEVRAVPGVEAAAPLMQRRTIIYVGKKRVQLMTMGIDPQLDHAIHDFKVVAGQPLGGAPGVLLHENFAKNIGAKPGEIIEILTTRRGLIRTRVLGLYTSEGTATTGRGAVLLMTLRAAQGAFNSPGKLDAIELVVDPSANETKVKAAIAKLLPENVTVHSPTARSPMAEQTSLSTELGLGMARLFSVLLALFVIINTFMINVTQRRRQLGIMRAIGATRGQIRRLVYSEALFLGTVGTVLGCVLGMVVAHYLSDAMGLLYRTALPRIELSVTPFLLAAAFGIGISLVGAAIPAHKASHLSPLEAMRDVLTDEIEGTSRAFVVAGASLVLLSAMLMVAIVGGWVPVMNAIWFALLLLIGLVFLLPLVIRPLSALVARLLRPWLRVEGRLARQQLVRHRMRTALTTGVVFIAVSTGIGLASAVIDNVQNVRDWYHKTIVADFILRAMVPDLATGMAADLPDALDAKVRQLPNLKSVETVRFVNAKAAGDTVVLLVREFSDAHPLELDLESGDPNVVRRQLHEGEVVLGSVLAQKIKLKAGDEITLQLANETHTFRIAAVANDYQAGGLTIYVDRGVAKRLLGVDGVDAYLIKADHRRLGEVRADLQKLKDEYGLILSSFSDVRRSIDRMMNGVVAGLWSMVALALLVAAFGVANTLTVTVLEQTRELGLLRILAMTRNQVRKTILAEALMMGILALVPGIAAGVAIAYLINFATLSVIGHPVPFAMHPWLLGGSFLGGLLIITAAAYVPAERAARLRLAAAIRQM